MKKIIPALLLVVILCSCSANHISFTPKIDFSYDSVIKVGDFSYNAEVRYKDNVVYITPTSSLASSMSMTCDGKTLCFLQKSFSYSLPIEKAPRHNPAYVLYQVLSNLQSTPTKLDDATYIYSGYIRVGEYRLYLNSKGDYTRLELKDNSLSIEFNN